MIFILCFLGALIVVSNSLFWRRRLRKFEVLERRHNASKIQELRTLKARHETVAVFLELADKDGAGAWPPKANHDSWPSALRPYKDIYLELIRLLPTAEPSVEDLVNRERLDRYRSLMRKFLTERINIAQVEEIMAAVEEGNWNALSREAYNGFYACIAVCRHAYRWATIPVVKVAQAEMVVDFPDELDAPWPYLQRNFGVTAESGNITANVLHSFDEKGERVYKINVGMSELIRSSEEVFFRMFYDVEILALPIYYEMVRSVICFEESDDVLCIKHLENITFRVRYLLQVFYRNLTESRVSHSVWLSYVQGFQAWGVGRMVDGKFIKYDGLSGSHVLFFQALDAFLGLDHYLTDEDMIRYVPARQRALCIALKKHSFRNRLKKDVSMRMDDEFRKIVKHLKAFRAVHRSRAMPYLEHPAPERLAMTAGKSVIEGPTPKDTREALKALDQLLLTRLKETV